MDQWVRWVRGNQPMTPQWLAEAADEWHGFAFGHADTDAQSVLHEMVREDNPPEMFQRFLHEQRMADHRQRGAPENLLFSVIGSATHHAAPFSQTVAKTALRDLAEYIKHELRSEAVCTSMAGHGVWYSYNRQTHRWTFDPDGNAVLIKCVAILKSLIQNLRERTIVRDDGPEASPSGRRTPSPAASAYHRPPERAAEVAAPVLRAVRSPCWPISQKWRGTTNTRSTRPSWFTWTTSWATCVTSNPWCGTWES